RSSNHAPVRIKAAFISRTRTAPPTAHTASWTSIMRLSPRLARLLDQTGDLVELLVADLAVLGSEQRLHRLRQRPVEERLEQMTHGGSLRPVHRSRRRIEVFLPLLPVAEIP